MEQQLDAFNQKRFELMVDMATKKLQQEIAGLKDQISSLHGEMGSLKSQMDKIQIQGQQATAVQSILSNQPENESVDTKTETKIVDTRPKEQQQQIPQSGAAKNAEPIKPRYGDYVSEDVAIDKFFYFGKK